MGFVAEVKEYVNEKLVQPLKQLTPIERVLVIVVGILGGIFPVPMLTTGATVVIAKILDFSMVEVTISTTINVLCTPLQFVMMPLFADFSVLVKKLVGASSEEELNGQLPSHILAAAVETGSFTDILKSAGAIIAAATVPWFLLTVAIIVLLKIMFPGPAVGPAERAILEAHAKEKCGGVGGRAGDANRPDVPASMLCEEPKLDLRKKRE